jgi:hypothetical protein
MSLARSILEDLATGQFTLRSDDGTLGASRFNRYRLARILRNGGIAFLDDSASNRIWLPGGPS